MEPPADATNDTDVDGDTDLPGTAQLSASASRPPFWRGIPGELRATAWLAPRAGVALVGVVLGIICATAALVSAADTTLSHLVLDLYGSHAHRGDATAGWILAGFDLLLGAAAMMAVLAHRGGDDGGLSSMGGVDRSRVAEGSSAAERRLDVATYAVIVLFFAVAVAASLLLV